VSQFNSNSIQSSLSKNPIIENSQKEKKERKKSQKKKRKKKKKSFLNLNISSQNPTIHLNYHHFFNQFPF